LLTTLAEAIEPIRLPGSAFTDVACEEGLSHVVIMFDPLRVLSNWRYWSVCRRFSLPLWVEPL